MTPARLPAAATRLSTPSVAKLNGITLRGEDLEAPPRKPNSRANTLGRHVTLARQAEHDVLRLDHRAAALAGFVTGEEQHAPGFRRVAVEAVVVRERFDVRLERRPALEAVLARERMLRVREPRARGALSQLYEPVLRLLLEVIEIRTFGKF
jgi:hypothetical protein